ncbi:FKBP12-associated protein-like protein [Zancudomyces culisetae]|uniref:FKBP12-associated protein-like protein n=1 Tax=Zancudomyces culisetae TaxID=1213189 RepID=A0A1R1PTB7_ZANCU|nr:FKBP12-associated protein-like protein [Zancudomyces culisetae]|eukprot:OMH84184.1 FKBP12-associated protein-like protein [Zancudomyces culisetae]
MATVADNQQLDPKGNENNNNNNNNNTPNTSSPVGRNNKSSRGGPRFNKQSTRRQDNQIRRIQEKSNENRRGTGVASSIAIPVASDDVMARMDSGARYTFMMENLDEGLSQIFDNTSATSLVKKVELVSTINGRSGGGSEERAVLKQGKEREINIKANTDADMVNVGKREQVGQNERRGRESRRGKENSRNVGGGVERKVREKEIYIETERNAGNEDRLKRLAANYQASGLTSKNEQKKDEAKQKQEDRNKEDRGRGGFGSRLSQEPGNRDQPKGSSEGKSVAASPGHGKVDNREMHSQLIKRLENERYECMICCEKVRRRQDIWSCDQCWGIFHLGCVSQWAIQSVAKEPERKWRCPGCQFKRLEVPARPVCFCGKHEWVNNSGQYRGRIPHACNQVCGKPLARCSHFCEQLCHPGRCPDCPKTEYLRQCYCGKMMSMSSCGEKKAASSGGQQVSALKSCGEVCGKLLGCMEHRCERVCHEGSCGDCTKQMVGQPCYCGAEQRTVSVHVGDKEVGYIMNKVEDSDRHTLVQHTGYYSCSNKCNVAFRCGLHSCESSCHSHQLAAPNKHESSEPIDLELCPFDISVITTCHCGQKSLAELGVVRNSCRDEVPACDSKCFKVLACGHKCSVNCHPGSCPPCTTLVSAYCRCGQKSFEMQCSQVKAEIEDSRVCTNVCTKLRTCKRHQCRVICCPGNRLDSVSKMKKTSSQQTREPQKHAELINQFHKCTLTCNKPLKCGRHKCQELCHLGPCTQCVSVSFEPLVCGCGMTRIDPPVPCGAVLPKCPYVCTQERTCGHHDLFPHDCHPASTPCPPCTKLVTKTCQCYRHQSVTSTPCHRSIVSCGLVCGKLLPCGSHSCERICHSDSDSCVSVSNGECKAVCGKLKSCGHPCPLPCHAPSRCPEGLECDFIVTRHCKCGNYEAQVPCHVGRPSHSSSSVKYLDCSELCKVLARNRALASAFEVDQNAQHLSGDLVNVQYHEYLVSFALSNKPFLLRVEAAVNEFICDSTKWCHWFIPMKQEMRHFLHLLAPYYNCTSASVDPEPKRAVCWTKRNISSSNLPIVPLSTALFDSTIFDPSHPKNPIYVPVPLEIYYLINYAQQEQ